MKKEEVWKLIERDLFYIKDDYSITVMNVENVWRKIMGC